MNRMKDDKKSQSVLNKELKNLISEYDAFNNNFRDQYFRLINDFESLINRPRSTDEFNKLKDELAQTIDILRSTQLDAECELTGEKLLSIIDAKIGKINKEPDKEWDEYYDLLVEFMKEHNHCYFEKGQRYKNKDLGDWVISQRKILSNKDADVVKRSRLMSIKILDKNILNWARDNYDQLLSDAESRLNSDAIDEDIKHEIDVMMSPIMDDHNEEHDETMRSIGLVDAHKIDPYINYTCWVWSNQDASWLRYFKELKRYYILNKHSAVPANYVNNDINLGTWVLRIRQEYKKGLLGALNCIPSFPDKLNRNHLLWNVYFIRETDLTKALQVADDAIDVLDIGERSSLEDKYEFFSIGEIND